MAKIFLINKIILVAKRATLALIVWQLNIQCIMTHAIDSPIFDA